MSFVLLMLVALLIDLMFGWPSRLYAVIKHPVVWIGSLITYLDNALNTQLASDSQRKLYGAFTTITVVFISVSIAALVSLVLPNTLIGLLIEAVVVSSLLASRSLYQHVKAVAVPLLQQDATQARIALSHIVGRDTSELEESAIASAAIESLAENASDGVFAPLFWGLLFGLPGIAGYKAINTLDSMIGHRTPKHLAFGAFAARLDDVVNVIPARLTAVLMVVVGNTLTSLSTITIDARKHRSPNAGWPEGAMACSLGIRLSGPRIYSDVVSEEAWLNESGADARALDIISALQLFTRTLGLTVVLLVITAVIQHPAPY